MRWAGHGGDERYSVVVGKCGNLREGDHFEGLGVDGKDLKGVRRGDFYWIDLVQDRDR